jgi:hypothetical protein
MAAPPSELRAAESSTAELRGTLSELNGGSPSSDGGWMTLMQHRRDARRDGADGAHSVRQTDVPKV